MSSATRYELVLLLHISADIVFVAGLLAAALVLMALSFQQTSDLARAQGVVAGMRRWARTVTAPALAVAWACGLWMSFEAGWWASHWLNAKLVFVVLLSALHGVSTIALRHADTVPGRAWRAAPLLALLAVAAVAWLALMKPT